MNTGSDPTISVEGVHKYFGPVKALQGVDLFVPDGKVLALLGPNGAGKTTLVHILTTLYRPDRGRATVAGLDVTTQRAKLRQLIGLAGQYAAVDENLTGQENLTMVGRLYHLPRREAARRGKELLARFGLEEAGDRVVKNYSGGMRRRLDLAASLLGRPQVLFLDEPTTDLDPRSRIDMWALIRELVQEGTTLMLTTQYLDEADELADIIAVIDHGRIIAEGTAPELKAHVGHDVLELTVSEEAALERAAETLQAIGQGEADSDRMTRRLSIPVSDGSQSLLKAVRRLDEAGIEIADLRLRQPSLDDVFLALTGRESSENGNPAEEEGNR